jgi:hypothetical protein
MYDVWMSSQTAQGIHGERVEAAVRLLLSSDLSTCGYRELDALAGALQRVRGFVAAYDVQLTRRRDAIATAATTEHSGTAPEPSGASTPTEPLPDAPGPSTLDGLPLDVSAFTGERDRRPGRAPEQDRARAEVCSLLPMFERALAEGRIDAAHVDAIAAAWTDLDTEARAQFAEHGPLLVEVATAESPERFRRRVRDLARRIAHDHGVRAAERQRRAQRSRRWIDQRTGMGHLHLELDPENTARVWTALDQQLATITARDDTAGISLNRLEVDAFVELVTASAASELRSPELCVLVDLATLQTGGFAPGSICETTDGIALTPAAARRLACEAAILPLVLGGDGVPLDAGRSRRLATREQRRALAAMYATCGLPGCGVRFERCRIHHLDPWLPTGPTDLDNLIPVCSRHHHDVHEGGWKLTMTPDRVITLRSPDGTMSFSGDTRDRIPPAAIGIEHHQSAAPPGTSPPVDELGEPHLVRVARHRVAELGRRRCRTGGPHRPHEGHAPVHHHSGP